MTDLPSAVRSQINCIGQFCLYARGLISAALLLCDFLLSSCPIMLRTALGVCSRHLLGKGLQMRIEYEIACRKAGTPEETVKAMRRMFDADYKRLKREKQARKNIVYYSLEHLLNPEGNSCYYDVPDPDMDVEQIVLHRFDLERLREILRIIPKEEKEFILDCFAAEWGEMKVIAEKYGMTIGAVQQRKRRILLKLRKIFFKDYFE